MLVSTPWLTAVHTRGKNHKRKIKKQTLKIGCWNVRTLRDGPDRPERRTAIITSELGRYDLDVVALSETRFPGEGELREINGYTIFWIGKKVEETREHGVGFAIRTNLTEKLVELPNGINERLMTLRLRLDGDRFVTMISAYAPTLNSSPDTISAFYQTLKEIILSIPKEDKVLLLGDFNARVGKDCDTWSALGPFGIGKQNDNGLCLLQLCTELDMVITNTFFHHKPIHKCSWTHPRSKQGHLIDYIIVRRRDIQDVRSTRVVRGADCDTDHNLVRSKLAVVIRNKIRKNMRTTAPKRIDCSALKNPNTNSELKDLLEQIEFDGSWETFRDEVFKVSSEKLGFIKRKNRDWFSENVSVISNLLNSKHELRDRLLNCDISSHVYRSILDSFTSIKSMVQKELTLLKVNWWHYRSVEVQKEANRKYSKTLYGLLKELYGPTSSNVAPFK